ncbi:hypothetical protein Pst134EB_021948 [Puccinia striiformis f. sp. tritici]|nr:hypothetical protein Pst134EB_021948 [Puccinia striiformis f. sp. tritici]
MDDGSQSIANISVFREDVAQVAYSKARKFDELAFTNNPYAKGGSRAGWDPETGAPKERHDSTPTKSNSPQPTNQPQPPQGPAAECWNF